MQRFKIISILIVSLLFSDCASKYSISNRNYETNQVLLSGKISDIKIIDDRSNITDEKIKLPVISFPGQFDKVSPILTDEHRQLIRSQTSLRHMMQEENHINSIKGFFLDSMEKYQNIKKDFDGLI